MFAKPRQHIVTVVANDTRRDLHERRSISALAGAIKPTTVKPDHLGDLFSGQDRGEATARMAAIGGFGHW